MPKDKKESIQAYTGAQGESVNGFVNRAIDIRIREVDETMEQDKRGTDHE